MIFNHVSVDDRLSIQHVYFTGDKCQKERQGSSGKDVCTKLPVLHMPPLTAPASSERPFDVFRCDSANFDKYPDFEF
jgi:hypothetical protein